MERIALVIGNGFDLSLGLPTSFSDFIESTQFDDLLENENSLCEYLKDINKNSRWIDVEKELANYSNENPNDEDLFDEYEQLKDAFFDYIEEVDSQDYKIDENSNAYMVLGNNYFSKLNQKEQVKVNIINFNYTNTFDRIKRKFMGNAMNAIFDLIMDLNNIFNDENPTSHIKFIYPHGCIKNGYIILGVEDGAEISEEHIFLKKTCDIEYRQFKSHVFQECDKIIFYGHSLGKTDHTYFKKFFLEQCKYGVKSKKIRISYYKQNGYHQIMKQLDVLTNHNIGALKEFNDLKLIDVSKNDAWMEF